MDANVRAERPVRGGFLLALALLPVLLLWFGRSAWGGWWVVNSTSTDTYMLSTIYELWAKQVGGGHLPVWFPEFAGGGYPVHAAWMYGLFYPPLALFMVLPPEMAWTWLSILHIAFGAAGMFAFLSDERRDTVAAASGAIVFALSNFMVGRVLAGHVNLLMPLAWAPWVLFCAVRTVRGETRALGWLALTASLGLLSGHVQIWFFIAPAIAAYALFEAHRAGRLRSSMGPLALAAALVVLITAIQWMPAWELFSVSGHPPEKRDVVVEGSAPVAALVAQLAPRLWKSDSPLAHEFVGLGGPLAIAAVLFAFKLRDGRRWFWFGVIALGLLLAMGLRNPVSEFLNDVPPFRFARAPGRALTLVVLGGGVLAGHAVADAVSTAAKWRPLVPAAFVVSALAVGVPTVDVVKSDFYEFNWGAAMPVGAAEHKVHVRSGRYPYLERWGIHTLRDVCPLDTPGYKTLTANPSPEIAWWFDMGTQIGDHAGDFDRPPADRAETLAFAQELPVRTFEGCGPAIAFECSEYADSYRQVSREDVLARVLSGERAVFLHDRSDPATLDGARGKLVQVRVERLPEASPSELVFRAKEVKFGWLFVPMKWYPGWKALGADGEWTSLRRANLAFAAAPLEVDIVRLAYRPSWLLTAELSFAFGLAGAIFVIWSRTGAAA